MWLHFIHLFWRTIHGMPLLVSSNWASWGLGLVVFVLYEVLAIAVRGWQDMKARWKQNVGIGLLATAGGYLVLFICSAIVTTYDEHHDSTGRWQVVVTEKNNLKAMLQQRDSYIETLEVKSCPACSLSGNVTKKEFKTYNTGVPSRFQDAPEGRALFITTNHVVEAPFRVNVRCQVPILRASSDFWAVEEGNFITQKSDQINDGVFESMISAPRLTPSMAMIVTVYAKTRLGHCSADVN